MNERMNGRIEVLEKGRKGIVCQDKRENEPELKRHIKRRIID